MSEQLMYHLISAMILEEKVMFYELIEIGKKELTHRCLEDYSTA